MGYTHYWKVKHAISDEAFERLSELVRNVTDVSRIPLANGHGDEGTSPIFEKGSILFNGVGPDGHETFFLENKSTKVIEFCKTARKPYDAVVCATLILAKKFFGNSIEISSDGEWEEWQDGIDVLTSVFGTSAITYDSVFGETDTIDNKFISAYI